MIKVSKVSSELMLCYTKNMYYLEYNNHMWLWPYVPSSRKMKLKTSVFGTSNNIEKITTPLLSRFFIVNMHAYAYEQFYEITLQLLTSNQYNVDEEIIKATIEDVWNTTKNIRDCIKIATMAKSVEDTEWLAIRFLKNGN
jgi:hypothetical protein